MIHALPFADFISTVRSHTPGWTPPVVFLTGFVVLVGGIIVAGWGVEVMKDNAKHQNSASTFWTSVARILAGLALMIVGIGWLIGGCATQIARENSQEAERTAKEELHIKAFALNAMGETIGAESGVYTAEGSYTDAFPDLIGADPGLNRFLVDDLVPKKRLELGSRGKSVMIEYTFHGPARYGNQTLNVYLNEGQVTVAGCHAASWMGCKDGRWGPDEARSGGQSW